jgi:hypothetical protein
MARTATAFRVSTDAKISNEGDLMPSRYWRCRRITAGATA